MAILSHLDYLTFPLTYFPREKALRPLATPSTATNRPAILREDSAGAPQTQQSDEAPEEAPEPVSGFPLQRVISHFKTFFLG